MPKKYEQALAQATTESGQGVLEDALTALTACLTYTRQELLPFVKDLLVLEIQQRQLNARLSQQAYQQALAEAQPIPPIPAPGPRRRP